MSACLCICMSENVYADMFFFAFSTSFAGPIEMMGIFRNQSISHFIDKLKWTAGHKKKSIFYNMSETQNVWNVLTLWK